MTAVVYIGLAAEVSVGSSLLISMAMLTNRI